jgi:hypothetical protein
MRFRLFSLVMALSVVAPAVAQLPQTRIGSIFPPGGQAGTTFEVKLSGEQDLEYELAPQMLLNHPGLKAEPVVDAAGAWQGGAFRITAAADVPPGRYEARLSGYYGASQPRTIVIESRPSAAEATDASPSTPQATAIDAPTYGRIESAADVDVFEFPGEEGKTIVIRCAAASLDSSLQPVIEVAAPNGRRIGFAGGAFRGETLLPLVLPATGEYRINVTDASYRGGVDFIYRLEVSARPVVASVFPPAGVAGQAVSLTLLGYNLPGGEPVPGYEPLQRKEVEVPFPSDLRQQPRSVLLNPSQSVVSGFDFVLSDAGTTADAVPIFFSPQPLQREAEPNNESSASQRLTVPADIAGSFEAPNDIDRFLFDATQGEVFYVEAFARRYESFADPVIVVDQVSGTDGKPTEKQIATADDVTENLAANVFDTVSDDPLLRFEAPADGTYRVSVRDRYFASRGGPLLAYRLSIRKPSPDFELAVVPFRREKADGPAGPDAIGLRKNESVSVSVYAFRRDGFNGAIAVSAEGLPAGVTSTGVTIAEGQSAASLVFSAAPDAAPTAAPVSIVGEAVVASSDGAETKLRRIARTGTLIRGGASSVEARLASDLVVSVLEETIPFHLTGEGGAIRVGQGSQVLLPVTCERQAGYAESIACAVGGLAKDSKVTAETKPFAPELASQQARLVIDATAPARSYEVVLSGTAKIDVSRFPLRLKKAKAAQDAATKAFTQADESLKQATAARDQAAKTLEAADAVAKSVPASLAAQTTAAVEAAKAALAAIDATMKAADGLRKQAEAAKQAADKAAGEAEKVSAVQKIDYSSPAPAVALTIVPAPATFALSVPENGQVKKGSATEIKVTVKRQNDFKGPVSLALALPQGVAGVTADPVTIPADQSEGTLRVSASADAAEGDVLFPAVRTVSDHNGPVQIDVPLTLKVVP